MSVLCLLLLIFNTEGNTKKVSVTKWRWYKIKQCIVSLTERHRIIHVVCVFLHELQFLIFVQNQCLVLGFYHQLHKLFPLYVMRCLIVGSNTFLPQLGNSASGFFRKLHSIPKHKRIWHLYCILLDNPLSQLSLRYWHVFEDSSGGFFHIQPLPQTSSSFWVL